MFKVIFKKQPESRGVKLKTLNSVPVDGKTVLYRSPYDIGLRKENDRLVVKDDSRIRATLPTLKYLIKKKCRIVILTYVGRPDGRVVDELRTTPHAEKLAELLGQRVEKIDDCVGNEVRKKIVGLKPGGLLMLENTRFYPGEIVDDDDLAKQMVQGSDLIVFDGFPQAHRIHASTTGILRHLPSCAGFYLQKEIKSLSKLITNPQKPFVVVIGGAKISDKVDAINNLLKFADRILIGTAVANVFLKALGYQVGDSFMEDVFVDKVKKEKKDWVEYAREILKKVSGNTSNGGREVDLFRGGRDNKIQLPLDLVIGDSLDQPRKTRTIPVGQDEDLVPNGWAILDIGPRTAKFYHEVISQAKTAFWNGPVGMFEDERFSAGSKAIAQVVAKVEGVKVISGGDTIEAARKFTDLKSFSHVSLAGGATLEFLAGKKLPALELLRVEK